MLLNLQERRSILVTGGTGSVGQAFLDLLLVTEPKHTITVLSRDESKQYALQTTKYKDAPIRWLIGDVRDRQTLREAIRGHDTIVHTAAMKHVPVCEVHPQEAVKTNVLAAMNLVSVLNEDASEPRTVVACSTDKACSPVTAMGISKAMMEKVFIAAAAQMPASKFCCVRFGNLLASRGSVLHLMMGQAKAQQPLTVTDPSMTRYVSTLEEAADTLMQPLVSDVSFSGTLVVRKCKAVEMGRVAEAVWSYYNDTPLQTVVIGPRPAEKTHEALMSQSEARNALDDGEHCWIFPSQVYLAVLSDFTPYKQLAPPERHEAPHCSGDRVLNQSDTDELVHRMIRNIEGKQNGLP